MQTNSSETPPTVNELYLHLHTVNHDGMTFIDTRSERFYDRLQRRRLELTQATLDQPVDDEAVYLNVAGECPKGRVYGFGSLGRKKRRYADPGASMSQMPEMVPRAEFDIVADQLRKELNQTTPDQPLDDEAVYYKVAGDCPKGCVYSFRSLWRKKRRYVDPDASTSQREVKLLEKEELREKKKFNKNLVI
ncbi:hypothetical protein Scep_023903 [Stephania cephalantha]|uniref:Uncharacterized protein n=1 Tax=Stephania cephalantha TaxID=152367 RepID=A0AAP0F107_9MAGN